MKRIKKIVGIILGIIIGVAAILSLGGLCFWEKKAAAISIIGGADGPTSIFIAGKFDFTPVYVGVIILILLIAGYMIYRKKRKGGS